MVLVKEDSSNTLGNRTFYVLSWIESTLWNHGYRVFRERRNFLTVFEDYIYAYSCSIYLHSHPSLFRKVLPGD